MLSIRSRTAENRAAAFEKGSVALICFERGSEALQKSGVAPRHAKTAWIKHNMKSRIDSLHTFHLRYYELK